MDATSAEKAFKPERLHRTSAEEERSDPHFLPGPAAEVRTVAQAQPSSGSPQRLVQQRQQPKRPPAEEIIDILAGRRGRGEQDGSTALQQRYKELARALDAPKIYPGTSNKAEEVSPTRIHPYRLFYPGQLYQPEVSGWHYPSASSLFMQLAARAPPPPPSPRGHIAGLPSPSLPPRS
jgi:hypothetical protein